MMSGDQDDLDLELDGVVSSSGIYIFLHVLNPHVQENDDLQSESGLGGQYDNKRALHNAMERKRRDSIKDSFRGKMLGILTRHIIWYCLLSGLQDCIPTLRGDKTSRAQVLKKTGEYITHMQKKINDHQVRGHRDSSHWSPATCYQLSG